MRFLIFSHLYIALCVVAMTLETVLLAGIEPYKSIPCFLILYFSTLIAYNIKAVKYTQSTYEENESEKANWVRNHISFIKGLVAISSIIIIICVFFLNRNTVYFLLPLGLLSIASVSSLLPSNPAAFSPAGRSFLTTNHARQYLKSTRQSILLFSHNS